MTAATAVVAISIAVVVLPALPAPAEEKPVTEAQRPVPRVDRLGDALPEGAVARLGTTRLRAPGAKCVAFSPDGKALATGSSDFTIRIWEASTGRELRRLQLDLTDYCGWIYAITISPDGRRLASADASGTVRAWDLGAGKELWRRKGNHPELDGLATGSLAFSPDSKTLAVSLPGGGTVALSEVATGKQVRQFAHGGVVCSVAFTPDGKILLSASFDGRTRAWDVTTGEELPRMGNAKAAAPMALSADGKMLATGGGKGDATIYLWDLAAGKEVRRLKGQAKGIASLAFALDGKRLLSGGYDETARLWDLETGKEVFCFHGPEPYWKTNVSCAWSPDGKVLALAGWDGLLRLYDAASGKECFNFGGHRGPLTSLAVSPDGRHVVTSGDKTVRLWDAATGKELRTVSDAGDYVYSLAWSPDTRVVVTASDKEGLRRWDPDGGNELARWRADNHRPWLVAFSPSGDLLASADGTVCLWETASGKLLRRLEGRRMVQGQDFSLAFSADGRLLATCGEDRFVRLWDVATGKESRRFVLHNRLVAHMAFSPDGRTLASSNTDQSVTLWEVTTGTERGLITGRHRETRTLEFSPDGRFLAQGGLDDMVHIYALPEEKEVRQFRGHGGSVTSLAYSRDGKRPFSGSYDTTVQVWDVSGLPEKRSQGKRLAVGEAESLWRTLIGSDAVKAYRAMWQLSASPANALPLIRERLRAEPAGGGKRIARLITDLDDDSFEVREGATKELESLGDEATDALRQALKGNVSAEVRRRVEHLLSARDPATVPTSQLRAVRAVEVLEQMGTAEARDLLKELAKGEPDSWLTKEAKVAQRRIR